MVMDTVLFTLAFAALAALIDLAVGCGSIPTSENGILSFYRDLQDGTCEECEHFLQCSI